MSRSLPHRLAIKILAPFSCVVLIGCSAEPNDGEPDMSTAVKQAAQILAPSAGADVQTEMPVTAEIMDIVEGGRSGTWAVTVRFANGMPEPCVVEVGDRRSGNLIVRDEVRISQEESFFHETHFQYRGRGSNLTIQVSEIRTGTVLATGP